MASTISNLKQSIFTIWCIYVAVGVLGCVQQGEQECVDPPEGQKETKKLTVAELGKVPEKKDPNADWCRTCVMGPKGWASCQMVYAEKEGEDRTEIKSRSRERACEDAGFKKSACPDKAVVAVTCKGDKLPDGADDAAKALQRMFFNKPQKPAKSGSTDTKPSKPRPSETETPATEKK